MTSRRTFMASILACATPPGFVRAGVLMPVAPLVVTSDAWKIERLDALAKYLDEQEVGPASAWQWPEEMRTRWISEAHAALVWPKIRTGA